MSHHLCRFELARASKQFKVGLSHHGRRESRLLVQVPTYPIFFPVQDEVHQPVDLMLHFDISPGMFPWNEPIPQQIENRRAHMSDLLIFDILLSSGGIRQPDSFYPPNDVPSLRRLLDAIQNSKYDALKRDCLVYFLLKWYNDGREERFQLEKCIPPQFVALADAYWYLDTGFNVAVRLHTYPLGCCD